MAYKGRSAFEIKGVFDNLKRAITSKKVITKDLENKSNPFVEGTKPSSVRVTPGDGGGFWTMPKEEYINQASKVYRKTGLKPTEGTRNISGSKSSHFELPVSNKVNIEVGKRTGGMDGMGREIKMSVVKNSQKETNKPNDSNKKSKPSNNKFKPSFKKQKGLYLRKGKFIG
jgi:hypothetical protein